MAGFAFARMHFWGRGIIFAVILSILMVPTQAFLIPQFEIVQNLGLMNTVWGIAAPGVFSAFGTFLMRQAFLGLPSEIEEAARLDGASPWQMFWRVMLPLTKPSLSALTIITVLFAWNSLLWPLVVTTEAARMPLAVSLATMQGQHSTDYPMLMAAALMAMAPVLVVFVVLQRALLQRLAAVRGRLSLCADQAAAAKWWLSMPMASVSAEGPMPKALSTRRTSPLMPGCRHQGRACPLRRARMTSNPLIVA